MHKRKHYYEILGLSPGASPGELKQAYRDMIRVWHPDRYSHDPRLQEKVQGKLKEIIEAYNNIRKYPTLYAKESQEEQRSDNQSEQQSPDEGRCQQTKFKESKLAKRRRMFLQNLRTFLILFVILFFIFVWDFSKMTSTKPYANIIHSSLIPGKVKSIPIPATFKKPSGKEKGLDTIDTVKINRGDLSITKESLFDYCIRLNGDIILQEKNKRNVQFYIYFRNIDNNEAILFQEYSEACAWFRLILLKTDGTITITDSFGNGSDLPEIKHQGKRITFSFPDDKGSFFRRGLWVFEDGQLRKKREKELSVITKLTKQKKSGGKSKSFSIVLKKSNKTEQKRVAK
jgi:hypothetical protein